MERLPRRMLSAWVPHARPVGAPRLTFGRSVAKAMDVFDLDSARWPELAAGTSQQRASKLLFSGRPAGWQTMLLTFILLARCCDVPYETRCDVTACGLWP